MARALRTPSSSTRIASASTISPKIFAIDPKTGTIVCGIGITGL
jgi:hypothetical protein